MAATPVYEETPKYSSLPQEVKEPVDYKLHMERLKNPNKYDDPNLETKAKEDMAERVQKDPKFLKEITAEYEKIRPSLYMPIETKPFVDPQPNKLDQTIERLGQLSRPSGGAQAPSEKER